jgi:phosphopantetheine adenylyltransferase
MTAVVIGTVAPEMHGYLYIVSQKSEPKGSLIIFICRLKLKVKKLKMALTLDERVEIVLLSGRQG